jgi:hypothetical protein
MRIGEKAPSFSGPAICFEGMRYLNSTELVGTWAVLSFLPNRKVLHGCSLESWMAWVLRDARLVFVQADGFPTISASLQASMWSGSVMLLDPLGRLHRRFGICRQTELKCRSFLIDPAWIIRLELVYDPSKRSAWWRNCREMQLQRSVCHSGRGV